MSIDKQVGWNENQDKKQTEFLLAHSVLREYILPNAYADWEHVDVEYLAKQIINWSQARKINPQEVSRLILSIYNNMLSTKFRRWLTRKFGLNNQSHDNVNTIIGALIHAVSAMMQ